MKNFRLFTCEWTLLFAVDILCVNKLDRPTLAAYVIRTVSIYAALVVPISWWTLGFLLFSLGVHIYIWRVTTVVRLPIAAQILVFLSVGNFVTSFFAYEKWIIRLLRITVVLLSIWNIMAIITAVDFNEKWGCYESDTFLDYKYGVCPQGRHDKFNPMDQLLICNTKGVNCNTDDRDNMNTAIRKAITTPVGLSLLFLDFILYVTECRNQWKTVNLKTA